MNDQRRKRMYSLIVFIVIVLASGWFGAWVDSVMPEQPEENSLGMGLFIILPIVSMITLRLITRDWRDIGIKPNFKGNMKWYLAAFAIYPAVMVVTVGIAWIAGSAGFTEFEWLPLLTLIGISVGGNFIKNIFEEFAWRGYLTPKLIEQKLNDWLIYLISGLVWALWHAAYYMVFLPDRYFESSSRIEFLLIGCVLMVGWSVMYVEIYRLTKSVWPCVLMHTAEDAFPTLLVAVSGTITFTAKGALWLEPTSGIITTLLFVGIGLWLRSVRIRKEQSSAPKIVVENNAVAV